MRHHHQPEHQVSKHCKNPDFSETNSKPKPTEPSHLEVPQKPPVAKDQLFQFAATCKRSLATTLQCPGSAELQDWALFDDEGRHRSGLATGTALVRLQRTLTTVLSWF